MNAFKMVRRLIMVSRPGLWLPISAIYLGGLVLAGPQWDWPVLLGLFFCTMPIGVILYGINDIADREADAISERKAKGIMGVRVSAADVKLFIWSGILTTLLFTAIFALTRHYASALAVLVMAVVSVLYSVPPLRFKVRPVLDALDHVLGAFAVFLMGYFASVTGFDLHLPNQMVLIILACSTMAIYGIAALVDYDTDKAVGDRTLAVFLGKRATLVWSAVLFGICAVIAWPHNHIIGFYFGFCAASIMFCAALPLQKITSALRMVVHFVIVSVPLIGVYVLIFGYS
jgi:4-hydroxybenzoate polyprenyltransferase